MSIPSIPSECNIFLRRRAAEILLPSAASRLRHTGNPDPPSLQVPPHDALEELLACLIAAAVAAVSQLQLQLYLEAESPRLLCYWQRAESRAPVG